MRDVEKRKAYMQAWRAKHPGYSRVTSEAWRAQNPDRVRESRREYYAANREAEREAARNRLRARRAAYPEMVRVAERRYKAENPLKARAKKAKRRALKLAAPGRSVTAAQWGNVLAESLGICPYCSERGVLTMDHVVPLVTGGAHDVVNIAAVCLPCNVSKQSMPLLIWLACRALRRGVL